VRSRHGKKFPKRIKIKPYYTSTDLSDNNIFIESISLDILKYSKFTILSQVFYHTFFSKVVSPDNSTNSNKSEDRTINLACTF